MTVRCRQPAADLRPAVRVEPMRFRAVPAEDDRP